MLALRGALLTACGAGGEVERFLEDVRREVEVYEAEGEVFGGRPEPVDLETVVSRMLYDQNRQYLGDDDDESDQEVEDKEAALRPAVDILRDGFERNVKDLCGSDGLKERFKAAKASGFPEGEDR